MKVYFSPELHLFMTTIITVYVQKISIHNISGSFYRKAILNAMAASLALSFKISPLYSLVGSSNPHHCFMIEHMQNW